MRRNLRFDIDDPTFVAIGAAYRDALAVAETGAPEGPGLLDAARAALGAWRLATWERPAPRPRKQPRSSCALRRASGSGHAPGQATKLNRGGPA